MGKTNEESKEFQERKKLIDIDLANYVEKHKMKMQQLEYERQTSIIQHEKELERMRIKSAEIRKSQERREAREFMESMKHE